METLSRGLFSLSADLVSRLETCDFADIEAYMKERERIFESMRQLQPNESARDYRMPELEGILEMDRKIAARMQRMHAEFGDQIRKLQTGNKSRMAYAEHFQDPNNSYFFSSEG